MAYAHEVATGLRTFGRDVADGFVEILHNGFALLGLAVACTVLTLLLRPDLRRDAEEHLHGWLQARQPVEVAVRDGIEPELGAIDRATAADPRDLPKQQAAVAWWLSKKYRVAPEPVSALVAEAYEIGGKTKLDPTLILAIMAIESSFNPFAQSAVGAQGLMQVMTGVHSDKYDSFGGRHAAFDPVTNLRVGVKVLQECIRRAGSLEAGLRYYVGAANLEDDGGYAVKVMAEHARLRLVAAGRTVPLLSPNLPAPAAGGITNVPASPARLLETAVPARAAQGDDAPETPAAAAAADKVALLAPQL